MKANNLQVPITIGPGYCQCGCGGKTSLLKSGNIWRGTKIGDPCQYIAGHQCIGRGGPGNRAVASPLFVGQVNHHGIYPNLIMPLIDPDTEFDLNRLRPRMNQSGEVRLMVAVLENAWMTACKVRNVVISKRSKSGNLFSYYNKEKKRIELEEWLKEKEASWLFSFENICSILGFDINLMRKKFMEILNHKEDKRGKREAI